jgi:transcription elongation factor Elf1
MILSTQVTIKINPANINYYRDYYEDIDVGDLIEVPVKLLMSGSKYKIQVQCDICGTIKEVAYCSLVRKKMIIIYYCGSCHRKQNNLKKYGVENVFSLPSVKDRIKEKKTSRNSS